MNANMLVRCAAVTLISVLGFGAVASGECTNNNPVGVIWSDGVRFAQINEDVYIRPGETLTLTNVRFRGGDPAFVMVMGDGDGDLDLWVYDEDTGRLIDQETSASSVGSVIWTPRYTGPFTIKVTNVGDVTERFLVVVNW